MLKDDMTLGRVITSNLQWATIGSCVAVPSYVLFEMGEERAAEMTLQQMTQALAPKLLPFMEFQSAFDPAINSCVTYSRLRVAEPIVSRYGHISMTMPENHSTIFNWDDKI